METKSLSAGSQTTSTETTRQEAIQATRQLLELMIRALVDHPDDVRITPITGSQAVIFEVGVNPEDVRRIIGRKGRTADALRELMTNFGSKARSRFLLEIMEPDKRT